MQERREIISLLKYMDFNPEPVGSGKACDVLAEAGFQVSEATVGRLLRLMDSRGLTCRLGFRGRVLTDKGREVLQGILHNEDRRRYSEQLANLVQARCKEDLVETLVARRAIEREIARLAALNITRDQVDRLERVVREYQHADANQVAQGDVAFHQLLAQAAGNKVLQAAMDLIRQDAQLSPVLGYIRQQVRSKVFADHRKIFAAVAAGDPEAAEQAMVNHIENLIRDVQKYWSRVNGE